MFGSVEASSGGGLFGALGSGGLFGAPAATGGGLFGSAAASSVFVGPAVVQTSGGDEEEFVVEEEVVTVDGWSPSVTLEVKDNIETGEEHEEEIYSQRSKLLRFRDGEWKERGLGNSKLLKHKATGTVRFLLRQEKTDKVVCNFLVIQHDVYCDLRPQAGSEKIWTWKAMDCSDDEMVTETFALKFGDKDVATKFKEAFDAAKTKTGDGADSANTTPKAKSITPVAAKPSTPTTSPADAKKKEDGAGDDAPSSGGSAQNAAAPLAKPVFGAPASAPPASDVASSAKVFGVPASTPPSGDVASSAVVNKQLEERLKVAEETARKALEAVEKLEQRVAELEAKAKDGIDKEALKKMSMPERIMYFQSLHGGQATSPRGGQKLRSLSPAPSRSGLQQQTTPSVSRNS